MTQDDTRSRNPHFPKWPSVASPLPRPLVVRAQPPEGEAEGQMAASRRGKWEPRYPLTATLTSAGELTWGVDETLAQLEKVLHLYRSGQYLQNSTAGSRAGEWPPKGPRGWGGTEQVQV